MIIFFIHKNFAAFQAFPLSVRILFRALELEEDVRIGLVSSSNRTADEHKYFKLSLFTLHDYIIQRICG